MTDRRPAWVRLLTSPRARLVLLGAVIVGGSVAALVLGGPSVDAVRGIVDRAGPWAPIVFVLVYAVLTVALIPGAVLTGAAGLLFGAALGTVLTVIGATLGSTVAFWIARRLGRRDVERLTRGRAERVDRWLGDRGFLAVLYLRLVPVVPFNLFNYAAGVSAVRAREFVLGTAIGIVPGSFAYAALGGSIDDPTSPAFLGALALVIVLGVVGTIASRRLRDRPSPERSGDQAA